MLNVFEIVIPKFCKFIARRVYIYYVIYLCIIMCRERFTGYNNVNLLHFYNFTYVYLKFFIENKKNVIYSYSRRFVKLEI